MNSSNTTLRVAVLAFALISGFSAVAASKPNILFVLTEDDGDLAVSTRRAAARADSVRLALSDQLFWVPFVDAMCVTHDVDFDPDQPCLVVPHDLVVPTVSGGPVHIDADTLGKLGDLRYPRLH